MGLKLRVCPIILPGLRNKPGRLGFPTGWERYHWHLLGIHPFYCLKRLTMYYCAVPIIRALCFPDSQLAKFFEKELLQQVGHQFFLCLLPLS